MTQAALTGVPLKSYLSSQIAFVPMTDDQERENFP